MKHFLHSITKSFAPGNDDNSRAARQARRKAIAELRALSDSQLKDIGISRGNITHAVIYGKDDIDQNKRAA